MKTLLLLCGAALVVLALPFLPQPGAEATPLAADPVVGAPAAPKTFTVDPVHSTVLFKIKHLGASWAYGRFDEVKGAITIDEETPANTSVKVEVAIESVNTANEKRDQHLLSPDFFDARQFPELSFESEKVSREGGLWKVEGVLQFHGAKKKVEFDVEKVGESAARGGGTVAGFHAVLTIDRNDFGMDYMKGGLGDDVEITVSLEAVAR